MFENVVEPGFAALKHEKGTDLPPFFRQRKEKCEEIFFEFMYLPLSTCADQNDWFHLPQRFLLFRLEKRLHL